MLVRSILLTSVALSLAACGGSSSSGPSFSELQQDFMNSPFFETSEELEPEVASFASLKAAGGASYAGQAAIFLNIADIEGDAPTEEPPTPTLLGEVALRTSFSGDAGKLTGSMHNFVDSDENAKTGTISITEGEVLAQDGGNIFGALFDGKLSGAGAGNRNYEGVAVGAISDAGDVLAVGVDRTFSDDVDFDVAIEDFDDLALDYIMILNASEN